MKLGFLIALSSVFLTSSAFSKSDALTDLDAALEKAKTEKKMLFVQYGRENCGNCQTLKGYIRTHALRLPESQFVYADLNCDDKAVSKAFSSKFKVEGNTLPFVVIAGPDGKQLASMTGYGSAAEYQNLIKQAKKAAGPAAGGSSSGGTGFNEAFKKVPQPNP